MKNSKLTNRIFALLITVVIMCSFSITAFAAELPNSYVKEFSNEEVMTESTSVVLSTAEEKTIPAWGSAKFYYDKFSFFTATIHISTLSSSSQGAIIVTAFNTSNPDIELSNDWVMGTNDYAAWTVATVAGTIIVQVNNHSPNPVDVRLWF